MTLSSDDLARLRTGATHLVDPIINAVPLVEIASALVNQTAFTYPLAQVTVDDTSGWSDVRVGHMVWIGTTAGAHDVLVGVVRKLPTSTTLYIDAKGLGDPGLPRNVQQEVQDNQFITIFKYRPPWGLLSSIRKKKFYKKFDVPYTNQGVRPDPVPVMGPWRQVFIDEDTGYADVVLDASDSFAWGDNNSITSYLWDLDGGTAQSGLVTDASLVGRFTPGFYELTCEVTDKFGKVAEGYRYLWVNTRDRSSANSPLSYRVPIRLGGDDQTRIGRELDLQVSATVSTELFPGQAFLVTETSTYGGEALTDADGDVVTSYVGYEYETRLTAGADGVNQLVVRTGGPGVIAQYIPIANQYMQERPGPSDWTHVTKLLSHPVGAYWYLTYHHAPYMILGHDLVYEPELTTYRRKIFTFEGDSLRRHLDSLGELFLGSVSSLSDGTTLMWRDPQYLTASEQLALSVKFAWDEGDFTGNLERTWRRRPSVGQVYAYAFSYDGGKEPKPYAALAPGHSQGQGRGKVELTPFIVTPGQGQARVNEVAGKHYALLNRRDQEFSLTADRNLDVAEPGDLRQWHSLTVSGTRTPTGEAISGELMLPMRVRRQWDQLGGVKTITIEWAFRTFGFPGITIPVNRGAANSWDLWQWRPGTIDPYQPRWPNVEAELGSRLSAVMAVSDLGQLAYTNTFLREQVHWVNVPGLNGQAIDVHLDYSSTFFTEASQNYHEADLRVWVLTWWDLTATAYVYNIRDITKPMDTWVIDEVYSLGDVGSLGIQEFSYSGRIVQSREKPDYLTVALNERDNVWLFRTSDKFDTVKFDMIADPTSGLHNYWEPIPLVMRDEAVAIITTNGDTTADGDQDYQLYYAPDYLSSFAEVTGVPTGHLIYSYNSLCFLADHKLLVGTELPGTPTVPDEVKTVTMDSGGYANFTLTGGFVGAGAPLGFGSGNVLQKIETTVANDVYLVTPGIRFNLGLEHAVGGALSFDWNVAFPSGMNGNRVTFVVRLLDENQQEYASYTEVALGPVGAGGYKHNNYTISWDNLPQAKVQPPSYIHLILQASWETNASGGDVGIWMDNISVGTATPLLVDTQRFLYEVSDLDTTPVWTDRTEFSRGPLGAFGIAESYEASITDLSVIGGHPETGVRNLMQTDDGGLNWTLQGRVVNEVGIKRGGDVLLIWGLNRIGLSLDRGERVYDRSGDFRTSVGYMGEVRNMTGVLF